MMALNMNQLALAAGGNSTPFGIGMPTPMDDTRQKLDEQVRRGPCPFDATSAPRMLSIESGIRNVIELAVERKIAEPKPR